jgi:hypothetical protein
MRNQRNQESEELRRSKELEMRNDGNVGEELELGYEEKERQDEQERDLGVHMLKNMKERGIARIEISNYDDTLKVEYLID